jgi:hypothetical protein
MLCILELGRQSPTFGTDRPRQRPVGRKICRRARIVLNRAPVAWPFPELTGMFEHHVDVASETSRGGRVQITDLQFPASCYSRRLPMPGESETRTEDLAVVRPLSIPILSVFFLHIGIASRRWLQPNCRRDNAHGEPLASPWRC